MNDEYMSSAEIKKKIAELKIKLAFQLEFEEELEKTLAECRTAETDAERMTKDSEKKILKEISAAMRREEGERRRSYGSIRVWKIAALAAVLMMISFGGAFAAICSMVEAGILKLDVLPQDSSTVFGLVNVEKEAKIPENWEGRYYPDYIPEGYQLEYADAFGVCYSDENGSKLKFDENLSGIRRAVDTENAVISKATLNGAEAMIMEKDGRVTVVWSCNDRYFVVSIEDHKEKALQVAASIEMID